MNINIDFSSFTPLPINSLEEYLIQKLKLVRIISNTRTMTRYYYASNINEIFSFSDDSPYLQLTLSIDDENILREINRLPKKD